MSNGVNTVHLIGNLGNDPEVKFTQGGMAVARLSVATSSSRKDKDGSRVEETQWHTVKAFGKLAEICGEYLRKGSKIYIEGSIRYSTSEKDGVTKYFTDIIADEMRMLDAKPEGQRSAPAAKLVQSTRQAPKPADDFADDDIPF